MEQSLTYLAVIVGILLVCKLLDRRGRRRPARTKDPLDRPLLWWTDHDPFTIRDLLNGGVCITGRAGSGKTSSSGLTIAEAIVSLGKGRKS